ncbi:EAL domain-containing protein [Oleisolibacter albus]|uniref:bifunctional diguanylate cyclase/phosphodiesterase n=1 Tax=Oleisolibacter albus TaxID=2171757 RepID=UPI000DF19B09|nr:EAL domain-containing protein [Oleisolibacter albus]
MADSDTRSGIGLRIPYSSPHIFLIAFVISLSVTVLAIWSLINSYRERAERLAINASNLAGSLEQSVGIIIDRADLALRAVVDDYQRRLAQPPFDDAAFRQFVDRQVTQMGAFEGLRISDADGRIRYGTGVEPNGTATIADRAYFTRLRTEPAAGLVIAAPLTARISGIPAMVLARRINQPDGSFGGVAIAVIELDHFTRLFSTLDLGHEGAVALRGADLGVIARFPDQVNGQPAIGQKAVSPELLAHVQSNPVRGTYRARAGIDGVERILSYRRIGRHPLHIVVGQSWTLGMQEWRSNAVWVGSFILLFVLVTAIGAWIASKIWTREVAAVRRAEVASARLHAVLQNAPIGLAILTGDRIIQLANSALTSMFGVDGESLAGQSIAPFYEVRQQFEAIGQQAYPIINAGGGFEQELLMRHRDGHSFWCRISGRMVDHTQPALGTVWIFEDISERKSYEQRVIHQATHDPLTGLPNRVFLVEWLRTRLNARPQQHPLAVLSLDVDGFRLINDSLGHPFGDELLTMMADRLRAALTGGETIARIGGDEFILVADGADTAHALERARQMATEMELPFLVQGTAVRISVSIGIAAHDGDPTDPENLLRDADLALTHARERGKGHIELFSPRLGEEIVLRHRLQTDLGQAIPAGQISVAYQPIVALRDLRLVGMEALARWSHPDLGAIPPSIFIPLAEETGQILPLGRYILETAVTDAARLRQLAAPGQGLFVNVNLSVRQLWDERYVDDLLAYLADGHTDQLKIEVTESMTMVNPTMALAVFQQFRTLGISLCMDDFGTGYSSLAQLSRFPFDVLKIDKGFVSALGQRPEQRNLLQGIVRLAHSLGLEVVAEGVETEEQHRILWEIGCDYGQGFLFSQPVPAEEIKAMLHRKWPAHSAHIGVADMADADLVSG